MRSASPAAPPRRSSARERPSGERAVEEDGHAELLADAVGHDERLRMGGAARAAIQVDERHHVDRAHMRVLADLGLPPSTELDPPSAARAPRSSASPSAAGGPASVKTVR